MRWGSRRASLPCTGSRSGDTGQARCTDLHSPPEVLTAHSGNSTSRPHVTKNSSSWRTRGALPQWARCASQGLLSGADAVVESAFGQERAGANITISGLRAEVCLAARSFTSALRPAVRWPLPHPVHCAEARLKRQGVAEVLPRHLPRAPRSRVFSPWPGHLLGHAPAGVQCVGGFGRVDFTSMASRPHVTIVGAGRAGSNSMASFLDKTDHSRHRLSIFLRAHGNRDLPRRRQQRRTRGALPQRGRCTRGGVRAGTVACPDDANSQRSLSRRYPQGTIWPRLSPERGTLVAAARFSSFSRSDDCCIERRGEVLRAPLAATARYARSHTGAFTSSAAAALLTPAPAALPVRRLAPRRATRGTLCHAEPRHLDRSGPLVRDRSAVDCRLVNAGEDTSCTRTCGLVPTLPLPPWRPSPGSAEGARIAREARRRLAVRAIQESGQRAGPSKSRSASRPRCRQPRAGLARAGRPHVLRSDPRFATSSSQCSPLAEGPPSVLWRRHPL